MKKFFVMGVALCSVLVMTSCKSSESAYKKAYEKAQAAQAATTVNEVATTTQQQTAVATTPVVTTPTTTDYSNVNVRTENVKYVSGSTLKSYGVVVGSFGVQANATALASKLQGQGYTSTVVKAVVNGQDFYRVVAASYDTKNEAAALRDRLSGTYQGAWLLYAK